MVKELTLLQRDPRYNDVWIVRVPGIYGGKGKPLPRRMSRLVLAAAHALNNVFEDVSAEGGHLYISDMFRSATEQQRAHEDWMSGRKSAYSPPSCSSVHEAARAIDIDAFDTGIGHRRVREILNRHGWTNIVETLTGPECWHYEFRESIWEQHKSQHGYAFMARAMKDAIGNTKNRKKAERREKDIGELQAALNQLLGLTLSTDGVYGAKTKEAVRSFQSRHGLQVDGVAGPITTARIGKELETQEIRELQSALNRLLGLSLTVNGIYGSGTEAAVRTFQSRHGLQVDGVAGPITKARVNAERAALGAN